MRPSIFARRAVDYAADPMGILPSRPHLLIVLILTAVLALPPVRVAEAASGPKKPKSLTLAPISGPGLLLSFADDSSDEDDFHVERRPPGGSYTEVAVLTSTTGTGEGALYSYPDSTITCGAEYEYRVRSHRHSDASFSSYASQSGTAYLTTSNLQSLAPATAQPGAAKVPLLGFTITSCSGDEELESVTVQYTGTTSGDVSALYLFRENDPAGGTFNAGADIEMTSDSSASGSEEYNLNPPDFSLGQGQAYRFYVVADLKTGAGLGNTVDAKIGAEKIEFDSGQWPAVPDAAAWDPSGSVLIAVPPPPGAPPPPPPTGGGPSGVRPTEVAFSGRAFPGATVLVVDKELRFETPLQQDVVTSDDGEFSIRFTGILQSYHSFGFVVRDRAGRLAHSKFFNVNTISESLVERDILVSPTVDFVRAAVKRGENIIVLGFASPGHSVNIEVNGTIVATAPTAGDGAYRLELPTGPLEFGTHVLRARQHNGVEGRESEFSVTRSFVVSRLAVVQADFNGDSRIDIRDWSVFLSRWLAREEDARREIDLNGDGKVDISDFSMFIRAVRRS